MSTASTVTGAKSPFLSTFPGRYYYDPAIFEAELRNIWYRTWVYVGHESEVPNANDYVAKSIGPQSVAWSSYCLGLKQAF